MSIARLFYGNAVNKKVNKLFRVRIADNVFRIFSLEPTAAFNTDSQIHATYGGIVNLENLQLGNSNMKILGLATASHCNICLMVKWLL